MREFIRKHWKVSNKILDALCIGTIAFSAYAFGKGKYYEGQHDAYIDVSEQLNEAIAEVKCGSNKKDSE